MALRQAEIVLQLLKEKGDAGDWEIVSAESPGDRDVATPLPELARRDPDLWAGDLRTLLREGKVDAIVHSLKDLDLEQPADLVLAAFPEREDARDAWVGAVNPSPRRAGTCSLRRERQLAGLFSGLKILPIRGPVEKRILQVDEGAFDGTVLALAGLRRAGLETRAARVFTLDEMIPCAGQGALVVECRAGDEGTKKLLAVVDSREVRVAVLAERDCHLRLGLGLEGPFAVHVEALGAAWRLRAGWFGLSDERRGANWIGTDADLDSLVVQAVEFFRPFVSGRPGGRTVKRPRVLVTRDEEDFEATRLVCERHGIDAVSLPLIDRIPLPVDSTVRGDWALFTSAASARLWPADSPPGGKVACVGPATAAACAARGWTVDFVPSRATGEVLARELPASESERCVLPVSQQGGGPLLAGLSVRGISVTRIDLYRTASAPPTPEVKSVLDGDFDALLFASPSAVRAWAEHLGGSAFRGRPVLALGTTTAAACRAAGFPVNLEGEPGLLEDLMRRFAETFPTEPHERTAPPPLARPPQSEP